MQKNKARQMVRCCHEDEQQALAPQRLQQAEVNQCKTWGEQRQGISKQ